MAAPPLLNEDEKTWERMFRTSGALYRLREIELDRVGLSLSQAAVLYFLSTSAEPLTPMKIARLTQRQPNMTAALLRRMESRGLVKRTKNLQPKNWTRVSLTKKGQAAFQRQLSERRAMNITACLSRQEVAILNTVLSKMHDTAIEMIRDIKPSPKCDPLL
jgi:DNA-binding MarR family transcriptional regulator